MQYQINKKSKVIGIIGEDLYVVKVSEDNVGTPIVSVIDADGRLVIDSVDTDYFEKRGIGVQAVEEEKRLKDYLPDYNSSITKDALIGFAVGDAYGVPYEFLPRSEVKKYELGG